MVIFWQTFPLLFVPHVSPDVPHVFIDSTGTCYVSMAESEIFSTINSAGQLIKMAVI